MQASVNNRNKYYFSTRIREKLKKISQYPITIVEAPSGFGKTIAIREYMRNELFHADYEWYTCITELKSVAWLEICELFYKIDEDISNYMKRLKTATAEDIAYIRLQIKNLKLSQKTYLVIDNYHLINFDVPYEMIMAFSMHENPNLHIIIITQKLDFRKKNLINYNNIYTINKDVFLLDEEGIYNMFRMEGIKLSKSELKCVSRLTEGWIAAVCLQIVNYKQTVSFGCSDGIKSLIELAAWNELTDEEKDFMVTMSVFDGFTPHQAAEMIDYKIMPGEIEERLKLNDFISFSTSKNEFVVHNIFLNYLRNRFYSYKTKECQERIFYKSGLSCASIGKYCLAARFFYEIKDFEAIMSMPITSQYLSEKNEDYDEKLFIAMLEECPEDILCKYPLTMLAFIQYAFLNGQYDICKRLYLLLSSIIEDENNLSKEEIKKIKGEMIVLEALASANLSKIQEKYEDVNKILSESPDIIGADVPFILAFPTVFGLFWLESGSLDEVLNTFDKIHPAYRKLNQGNGAGVRHLIRAEVMLFRGEDNEAEVLCYKAIYEAHAYKQISLCIYAEVCLARIFILRGDSENFFNTLEKIKEYSFKHSNVYINRMIDMCMATISLFLGIKDYVSPWICDIEEMQRSIYAPIVPFLEVMRFRVLLMDGHHKELLAAGQVALDRLRYPNSSNKYLMPQIYYLIFLAVAKHNSGEDLEAEMYLKSALDIALPDRIYLPFVSHECMDVLLSGLAEKTFNEGKRLKKLISFCKRYAKCAGVIKKALIGKDSPLTPREMEIASLTKKRFSAKEIADKLYISETTVKSTLRSVYSKLNIHSRKELENIEF